eukprot:scaffold15099_cov37-Tisochrysis_lutea.AAC.1
MGGTVDRSHLLRAALVDRLDHLLQHIHIERDGEVEQLLGRHECRSLSLSPSLSLSLPLPLSLRGKGSDGGEGDSGGFVRRKGPLEGKRQHCGRWVSPSPRARRVSTSSLTLEAPGLPHVWGGRAGRREREGE